jgi:DNA recombination protein RmuC
MNEIIIYLIITALTFLFLGWLIGNLMSKNKFSISETALKTQNESLNIDKNKLYSEIIELKKTVQEELQKKENLLVTLTQKESLLQNMQSKLQEQKEEVGQLQEKFTKEFENLANKILEEKSNKFTEQNKENLKLILNPLNEKILHFEQKVEQTHKESIDYHAALRQQIIGLKELNNQMSKETLNLTKALKGDSKMQGNWGELVLERVLEKSGLEKGREYEM